MSLPSHSGLYCISLCLNSTLRNQLNKSFQLIRSKIAVTLCSTFFLCPCIARDKGGVCPLAMVKGTTRYNLHPRTSSKYNCSASAVPWTHIRFHLHSSEVGRHFHVHLPTCEPVPYKVIRPPKQLASANG